MGGKKKYINIFGSFTEPFNYVVTWTANQSGLVTLTFDLKVVSKSRVTWATSVPILVFLGLSVLDLGPMYTTDRQTSDSITA